MIKMSFINNVIHSTATGDLGVKTDWTVHSVTEGND